MRTLLALSGVFALLSLIAFAWSEPRPEQQVAPLPGEVRLTPAAMDLGRVALNETIEGQLTLSNDTDQQVRTGSLIKSCSCTEARLDATELAPGEKTQVHFRLKTGTRRGRQADLIVIPVTTADGRGKHLLGRIQYQPCGVFDVEPASLTLDSSSPRATVKIRVDPQAARKNILAVRVLADDVKAEYDASSSQISVAFDPQSLLDTALQTQLLIYTDHPAEDLIRIPVQIRNNKAQPSGASP